MTSFAAHSYGRTVFCCTELTKTDVFEYVTLLIYKRGSVILGTTNG